MKNVTTNKSQTVREMLEKMPNATAQEVADAAGKALGTTISSALVYMQRMKVKKQTQPSARRLNPATASTVNVPEIIHTGKRLLALTGGVDNAVAILKAVEN